MTQIPPVDLEPHGRAHLHRSFPFHAQDLLIVNADAVDRSAIAGPSGDDITAPTRTRRVIRVHEQEHTSNRRSLASRRRACIGNVPHDILFGRLFSARVRV